MFQLQKGARALALIAALAHLAFAADFLFIVHSFSPWPGYAISNGSYLTGDFNHEGNSDIVHFVANTNYANIWLSNGDGTFKVSRFSPWPGYPISNGSYLR